MNLILKEPTFLREEKILNKNYYFVYSPNNKLILKIDKNAYTIIKKIQKDQYNSILNSKSKKIKRFLSYLIKNKFIKVEK